MEKTCSTCKKFNSKMLSFYLKNMTLSMDEVLYTKKLCKHSESILPTIDSYFVVINGKTIYDPSLTVKEFIEHIFDESEGMEHIKSSSILTFVVLLYNYFHEEKVYAYKGLSNGLDIMTVSGYSLSNEEIEEKRMYILVDTDKNPSMTFDNPNYNSRFDQFLRVNDIINNTVTPKSSLVHKNGVINGVFGDVYKTVNLEDSESNPKPYMEKALLEAIAAEMGTGHVYISNVSGAQDLPNIAINKNGNCPMYTPIVDDVPTTENKDSSDGGNVNKSTSILSGMFRYIFSSKKD